MQFPRIPTRAKIAALILAPILTLGLALSVQSSSLADETDPTPSVSVTPSDTPTETPTESPSETVTPSETATPSESPSESVTPSDTPTVTPSEVPSVTPSVTPSQTVTPTPTPTVTTPPPVINPKLVTSATVIFAENHGNGSFTTTRTPKIAAYGKRFSRDNNARAITHPSKPNYLGSIAGSTLGESSNRWALESSKALPDLIAAKGWAGGAFRSYAQGMGTDNCLQKATRGAYAAKHNPAVYFVVGNVKLPNGKIVTKRSICEAHARDAKYWAGDAAGNRLGVVNFIIPDNNHNWHDGSARAMDDYVGARAAEFIKSPDYKAGGAFIIVSDEDEKSGANDIPFIVIHKSLDNKHLVSSTRVTLYDLHSLLSEVGHVSTSHIPSYKGHKGLVAKNFGLVVK
jgi:hypothetical protein